jgi:hypothetical protein
MMSPAGSADYLGDRMKRTPLIAVLSFSLGATLIGGVAVATTKSSAAVKACATSKGTLTLRSAKGKCAKGSHAVTIAKQGPRGAAGKAGKTGARGPGAASSVATAASPTSGEIEGATVPISGTTLTLHTECLADDHAELYIVGAGDYLVTGAAEFDALGDADASTFYSPTSSTISSQNITTGGNVIDFENNNLHPTGTVDAGIDVDYESSAPGDLSSDLLVVDGGSTFTINVSLFVDESTCAAAAQLTPGGLPAA